MVVRAGDDAAKSIASELSRSLAIDSVPFSFFPRGMVYRKGELNSRRIDQGWPHQVALPAEALYGDRYVAARIFCETLSLAPIDIDVAG